MKKQTMLILLSLIALYAVFTVINGRIENGAAGDAANRKVDLSTCSLVELDENRIMLTVPAYYTYGATASDLQKTADTLGYEAILLNEDGSVTYTITKEQHAQMLLDIAGGIREKLSALPGSKDHKNVTAIEANEDFTEFKVSLSTGNAELYDSLSVSAFKMYGIMYNCFAGVTDEAITVEYYNNNGDLISTYTSVPRDE